MEIVEARFEINGLNNEKEQLDSINLLLGSYRMNGQLLGREFVIVKNGNAYVTHLKLPAIDALDREYNNKYVREETVKLEDVGLNQPEFKMLGQDPESASLCHCEEIEGYILFTTYVSLETPLRCLRCFGTVPLYRIPKTYHDEYYDVICWEGDYQSCDRLQMNCTVGERFAMNQMSNVASSLSRQGIEICRQISNKTNRDTYYYLYKGKSKSIKQEKKRGCPSCNGAWLLDKPLHGMFDFKCKNCLLLSNISWDVR